MGHLAGEDFSYYFTYLFRDLLTYILLRHSGGREQLVHGTKVGGDKLDNVGGISTVYDAGDRES